MNDHRWGALTMLAGCVVLLAWGIFVLGFLTEPSAVGRVRVAIVVVGGVSIVLAAGAAVAGVRMLISSRT